VTEARRKELKDVSVRSDTHAGLWLDKFLTKQTTDQSNEAEKAAKGELLAEVARLGVPDGYQTAYELRVSQPAPPGLVRLTGTATVEGRVVVGLGQKGPTEIGITLEHTWGVPILPGSSLKGLAAAAAHRLYGGPDWSKPQADGERPSGVPSSYDWLFGTTEDRGAVSFLDAWWIPDGKAGTPLALDVMTPHHIDYYGGKDVPPSDMDSPNPVAFLTAVGRFKVIIEGEKAWAETAWALLEAGLRELGIGAKTNAGYGRLTLVRDKSQEELRQEELAARFAGLDNLVQKLKGPDNATEIVKELVKAKQDGCPPERLKQVASRLVKHPKMSARQWKEWSQKAARTEEEKKLYEEYFKPAMGG
jgi:CRISPR-associated protein Cmr6